MTKHVTRIDTRFEALKKENRPALITFVTAGDPDPETSAHILGDLAKAGADIIELGMPFSDPMADGPVIQHASERALANGVGPARIFEWVRQFRTRDAQTPIVLMGYLNPVEILGASRFAQAAVEAGVDGVLLVDCPVEEFDVAAPLREAGLRQILLAAPTTTQARLQRVCGAAQGFLYYVSFVGITGADRLSPDDVRMRVEAIRRNTPIPVAVGFGVRDAASAAAIGAYADAVVIGSALVDRLAAAADADEACARAREFLAPIRAALDGGR